MSDLGFSLFQTSIGRCALVFGDEAIATVCLPDNDPDATRRRVLRHFPAACEATPTAVAHDAITRIVSLLAGRPSDLSPIPLDMSDVPPFHRRVYEVTRQIPPGATLSYGEVARRLGAPGAARAVGQALGRNPFAIVVPCHRVLAAHGKIGGFTATGGTETKRRMLAIERELASVNHARDGVGPLFDRPRSRGLPG